MDCVLCGRPREAVRKMVIGIGEKGVCDQCINTAYALLRVNRQSRELIETGLGLVLDSGSGEGPKDQKKKSKHNHLQVVK